MAELNLWSGTSFQNRTLLQIIVAGLQLAEFPDFEGLMLMTIRK
jgi:hypothetical protein